MQLYTFFASIIAACCVECKGYCKYRSDFCNYAQFSLLNMILCFTWLLFSTIFHRAEKFRIEMLKVQCFQCLSDLSRGKKLACFSCEFFTSHQKQYNKIFEILAVLHMEHCHFLYPFLYKQTRESKTCPIHRV